MEAFRILRGRRMDVDQFGDEYALTTLEESAIVNAAFSKLLGYELDTVLEGVWKSGMN